QQHDKPQAVRVEDRLDHVADRRELEEGAHHGDPEVLLEVRAAPEGHCGGHRYQHQAGGHLADRDVDRDGRHHAAMAPSRRFTMRWARRLACPRSCVTTTIDTPVRTPSSASVASTPERVCSSTAA